MFKHSALLLAVSNAHFQLASMQTSEITEPDWYFTYFHSSRIPSKEDPNTHNRWRYKNPALDELVVAGRAESDRAGRREIYGRVQAILATDLPIEKFWRDQRSMMITEGPIEILKMALARHVLRTYG